MSDAALLFAVACGFTMASFALVLGPAVDFSERRRSLWICAGVALLLFGAIGLDLIFAAGRSWLGADDSAGPASDNIRRFHTEFGVSAILAFIFLFPFYGFFSARIFPAINEQSVLALCILSAYVLYVRQHAIAEFFRDGEAPASDSGWMIAPDAFIWLYLAAGVLGLGLYFGGLRSTAVGVALAGWHLIALTALSFLEWPAIVELFTARDPGAAASGARMLWVFFASAAAVVLAFYMWFAVKFLFIAASCLRLRGRELARAYFAARWERDRVPTVRFATLAGLQIAICAANAIFEFAPHDALIQALVALGPVAALLSPGSGDSGRTSSATSQKSVPRSTHAQRGIRFAQLPACALLGFALGFAPGAVRAESPGSYSQPGDFAYRPLPGRDGYTQAYSVNFQGQGFRIYTVFLISNIGPKSLNNGVAVLVYRDGKSAVFTSEQDFRTLKAKPGGLDIHSGPHRLSLSGGPPFDRSDRLRLSVSSPQFRLSLEYSGLQRGVRLSGGPVAVSGNPADYVRADIPIAFARAQGTMFFRGKEYKLNGSGGMDSIYTNTSPHRYARRFTLSRTFDRENGFFLGVIQGDSDFPDDYQARFAWLDAGRVRSCGRIGEIEVLASRRDPLSGYHLPVRTAYHARTDAGRDCRIVESFEGPAGGYSVLESISSFLRWILRVFFARPYIVHYDTGIVVSCRNSPDEEYMEEARFTKVQKSHYLINE